MPLTVATTLSFFPYPFKVGSNITIVEAMAPISGFPPIHVVSFLGSLVMQQAMIAVIQLEGPPGLFKGWVPICAAGLLRYTRIFMCAHSQNLFILI